MSQSNPTSRIEIDMNQFLNHAHSLKYHSMFARLPWCVPLHAMVSRSQIFYTFPPPLFDHVLFFIFVKSSRSLFASLPSPKSTVEVHFPEHSLPPTSPLTERVGPTGNVLSVPKRGHFRSASFDPQYRLSSGARRKHESTCSSTSRRSASSHDHMKIKR